MPRAQRAGVDSPRCVLVFRQGSIGDFVVALPCLHFIRKTFPNSQIVLLTNTPADGRVLSADEVLGGSALLDASITYTGATRNLNEISELRTRIRRLRPDLLVYLAAMQGYRAGLRDYVFFRWCGIRRIVGVPRLLDVFFKTAASNDGRAERESDRLARLIAAIGTVDCSSEESWDLNLTRAETDKARRLLAERFSGDRARMLVAVSLGTKQSINDWGVQNWTALLEKLRPFRFNLLFVGGAFDYANSEQTAAGWPTRVLNLCGRVAPREAAAVLKEADLFICHDSGPMHLAASVGTPCVAIFSRRNPPGKWFPFGHGHRILYPTSPTAGIKAISPQQVFLSVVEALQDAASARPPAARLAG